MPELRFHARDASPDSLNFSLFSSSASASVDRCSSASDAHDHNSLFSSDVSAHLAGRGFREDLRGPDPDLNHTTGVRKHNHLSIKVEKAKAQKVYLEAEETKTDNQAVDSAQSSFSQALKECQNQKSRSETRLNKSERRRPASLDLNNHVINITSSSPRFGVKMKSSVSAQRTNTFPSPGTPNYRPTSIGVHKGWSSERVPTHSNATRRHVNGIALLPYNHNGRTLPSKWEDAERWIFSPISGDGALRQSFQHPQRRPKSKSGPLGPPGTAYYSMYSPALPMFEGGNGGNLMDGLPFSAGVIAAECLSKCPDGLGGRGNFPLLIEPCMARSVSIHGCSEPLNPLILQGSNGTDSHSLYVSMNLARSVSIHGCSEPLNPLSLQGSNGNDISRDVSRRDMATQMSPEGSPYSSPRGRLSGSMSTAIVPMGELQGIHSSTSEIRDVLVDDQITVTRWSKKARAQISGKGSEIVDDWKRKAMEDRSASWEVSETTKISKVKREEAKITAWENLQKAKAEAAIRKLEMKLEKRRSSSMDKIMNKLRSAQKKAQEMRGSVLADLPPRVARSSYKAISLHRTRQIGSLSGCFTCHAF